MMHKSMEDAHIAGQLTSLAGRYAKTLYELAQARGDVKLINNHFKVFLQFLEQHSSLEHILLSSSITKNEQEKLFETFVEELKLDNLLKHFFGVLVNNRRIHLLKDIQHIFQILYDRQEKIQHIDVISAYPLTKDQEKTIHGVLSGKMTGTLLLKFTQDPKLLGGIFVRFGHHVVDLSFLHQLNLLTQAMKGTA